jgi:hypothetical protein
MGDATGILHVIDTNVCNMQFAIHLGNHFLVWFYVNKVATSGSTSQIEC